MSNRAMALLAMIVLCMCGSLQAKADIDTLFTLGISLDQQGGVSGGWTRVGPVGAWKNTLAGTILNRHLYTVETSGVLYETDLATGVWKALGKPEFANTAFLFAANKTLYSIESSGSLYRISPDDGSWEAVGTAGAWKNTVAGTILDRQLYTVESSGALYVTDLETGNWKQIGKPEFRDTTALLAAGGALYAIHTDGTLYRVDLQDGGRTQIGAVRGWKRAIGRAAHHEQLVTAENDGRLYLTDLKTGTKRSVGQREFGNTQFMFAVGDDIYTIETDGSLYHVFLKPGDGITAYDWCPAEVEKVFREQGKSFYRQIATGQINGAKATHAGILDGFEWLQASAKQDDLVVIYIGCHGATDPDKGWGVVTADGEMLWGNEIKTALGKLPCPVLAFVETCTSGGFAMPHKDDAPLPPNVTAICACSPTQTTDNQLDMALAEGLYGRADFNRDGKVTLDELIRYIPQRYKEWWPNPKEGDGSQTPVLVKASNLAGDLSLTSVSSALAAVNYKGTLYSALLEGQDGPNYRVHLLGWSSQPGKPYFLTDKVERNLLCLPTDGAPLLAEKGGKWLPARLLSHENGTFKIRYLGTQEEAAVSGDHIRYPFVGQSAKEEKRAGIEQTSR